MNERLVCDASIVRAPGDGAALKRILLCPDGLVKSSKGDFTFNAESYAAIRREFDARKKSTVIDWEHQSLDGDYAAPDGRAPAAGWIEALEYVPGDGLYGQVKWNDDAAEEIRKDHYRYLSPTVILRKEGRLVVGLDSAALTNKPAIHGMPRVAAKQTEIGDMEMLKQLRELLRPHCPDLTDQADEAATLAACKSALAELAEQRKTVEHVRGAMKLPSTANGEVVRLALDTQLSAQKSNSDEVMALKQQVEALQKTERERRGQAMIDEAIRRNKLKPEAKSFAAFSARVLADPDLGKEMIDMLPEVPPSGQMVAHTTPPNAGGEEAMIAEAMKEHGNKLAEAYSALQRKLIAAEVEGGLRKEVAIERLTQRYPKIFNATN